KIEVATPERLPQHPAHSIDLIVLHSVVQYLSADSLDALLAQFRRLLKPNGVLLLGDIIPPDVSPLADSLSLLRMARAHGFLGAALLGLLRTLTSDYARLRATLGLARYSEAGMLAKLRVAGYSATRAGANIGHNQQRMTFLAHPQ